MKLGEKASLTLGGLSRQQSEPSVFRAVMDVAKGAFRFTTTRISKLKGRNLPRNLAGNGKSTY
ncbi:MAG: hypothetical protein WCZ98_02430 [Sideroxydans sp.]